MRMPVLTPLGRLTGVEAIRFADENGLYLCGSACRLGQQRNNLSPAEAVDYLKAGASVWVDIG